MSAALSAVPRDIEPEIGELPDVYLYTIDDLSQIIEGNVKQRMSAAESAEALVADGATHYIRERRAHHGQALLRKFRENSETAHRVELDKALRELASGTAPEVVVANFGKALTNKLIHSPTVAIRAASAEGRADLLEYLKTLYGLD